MTMTTKAAKESETKRKKVKVPKLGHRQDSSGDTVGLSQEKMEPAHRAMVQSLQVV